MSLQLVPHSTSEPTGSGTALQLVAAGAVSQEEQEQRQHDANELEKKLNYVTENVPTRIVQVMGSNAGAGSGEFHMYRMARRRELQRLDRMKREAEERDLDAARLARKQRLEAQEEERTAKRRLKRQKQKARKGGQKGGGAQGAAPEESRGGEEAASPAGLRPHVPDLD